MSFCLHPLPPPHQVFDVDEGGEGTGAQAKACGYWLEVYGAQAEACGYISETGISIYPPKDLIQSFIMPMIAGLISFPGLPQRLKLSLKSVDL